MKNIIVSKLFHPPSTDLCISAIAIAHDTSFKTDQDILVLPLDLQKFDTHENLTDDVFKHFGKVYRVFLGCYLKYNMNEILDV